MHDEFLHGYASHLAFSISAFCRALFQEGVFHSQLMARSLQFYETHSITHTR